MKKNISKFGAAFIAVSLFITAAAMADYITVLTGSGTPSGTISAAIGQVYVDNAAGVVYVKTSGNGTTTGWTTVDPTVIGNAVRGTVTLTAGSGTLANASITTNSVVQLTASGTVSPSSAYAVSLTSGTAIITGGTNTTTAKYLLFP